MLEYRVFVYDPESAYNVYKETYDELVSRSIKVREQRKEIERLKELLRDEDANERNRA